MKLRDPLRDFRKPFGSEKPFLKLRLPYSVKLGSWVLKGIKIEITAKFRASRSLRVEDTKRPLGHPKCTRKVLGLSRNGRLVRNKDNKDHKFSVLLTLLIKEANQ